MGGLSRRQCCQITETLTFYGLFWQEFALVSPELLQKERLVSLGAFLVEPVAERQAQSLILY